MITLTNNFQGDIEEVQVIYVMPSLEKQLRLQKVDIFCIHDVKFVEFSLPR